MCEKGNDTLERIVRARKRAYPVDPLSVAETLLAEALHCIGRVSKYSESQSAERLDGVLKQALEVRSQLPEGHNLELVLKAFHDGDEAAQIEAVKLAHNALRVNTGIGWPSKLAQAEERTAASCPLKVAQKSVGHPGLDHDELIYRLAKAQEAEEIRRTRGSGTCWKEIAKEIGWDKGTGEQGLALLRDARQRLSKLEPDDPLLEEVREYRAQKTGEM